MKPLISIYVPAIRPELWIRMYESLLSSREVDIEIIFVGHIAPSYKLPSNTRYIFSTVKPSQCAEIGFRDCKGEFCIFGLDDIVFGDRCLDVLYNKFIELNNSKAIISCTPYLNGVELDNYRYRFWDRDRESPITPICGLYKKDFVESLGCVDRNFICSVWDVDLSMRAYEVGGCALFCEEAIANEIVTDNNRLCNYGLRRDRPVLESLWTMTIEEYNNTDKHACEIHHINTKKPRSVIRKIRSRPLEPFTNENILTLSQGVKGKWK